MFLSERPLYFHKSGETRSANITLNPFPNVEIIEDKYILNVSCSLWDKLNDIQLSFEYIKQQIKESNSSTMLISFDDAYNYYYKFCNTNSYKFIVSKRYFEKYLAYKFFDYIVYEKFIKTEYILNNNFL